jgi:hypothetical protein
MKPQINVKTITITAPFLFTAVIAVFILTDVAGNVLASTSLGSIDFYADHHHQPITPILTVNHTLGQPGSYFVVSGTNFVPYSCYQVTVNGHLVSASSICADDAGNLSFELSTPVADAGLYNVEVNTTGQPGALTSFETSPDADTQWPAQGLDRVFDIPAGIAFDHSVFLPLIIK